MALVLVLSFGLVSCVAPPAAAPQAEGEPAAGEAAAPAGATDGELVVALNGQPARLQPQQPVGRLNELVNALIFDALTTHDESGALVPSLAESWERLDDLTWEFKLREGATFHNGEPVTADDVKFSYEQLVLNPDAKSPHLTFLQTIQEVKVIDPLTFQIITNRPDVILPSRVFDLYGSVVPMAYYNEVGDAGFDAAPIGAGPYKFVDWVKDSHMTLERYDGYWGTKPAYERLVIRFITDDAARVAALLAGEVDIASTVPPIRVEEVEASESIEIRTAPSTRFYFLVMDTNREPFDDPNVRHALNLALDRDALVQGVSSGYGTPIASVFIPQTFAYDPSLQPVYDPEMAQQLLAEAGYPDGLDVQFDAFTGSIVDHSKLAEAVAAQLSDVGIRAALNIEEFGVFGPKRLAKETAPLYIYSLGDWAFDMGVHLKSYVEGSQGYYHVDPELGAMIDDALATFDETERAAKYAEIQKQFYDQNLYGSLYQLEQIWGVAADVDWQPQPDEMLRFHLAAPQ
jgi:peptide/nickel transport system substrate-binding protein